MRSSRLWILSACLCVTLQVGADEPEFAPADLYAFDAVTLQNGMRVILNNRGTSPNVAIRLVVGTGMHDFPCDKRELPHIVEHLMFSGFDDLEEADLDQLVEAWGGTWNAYTHDDSTTYELRVHSSFLEDATLLLDGMFTKTQITQADLDSARVIVHSESGGEAGAILQAMYRYGIYEGNADRAYREFVPGSTEWCENLIDATSITLEDVHSYMQTAHQPSNLTLIVVGDFDPDTYKALLSETFGSIESTATLSDEDKTDSTTQFVPTRYATRTDTLLGQEGYVCLEFGLPKWNSAERPTIVLLEAYLEARMFEVLRTDLGLSYDPGAALNDFGEFSTLMLDAVVSTGDMDDAMYAIEQIVDDVRREGVPESRLAGIKQGRLYAAASAYETNTSIADFYERGLPRWQATGAFIDLNTFYNDVTTDDTIAVAQKYLDPKLALSYTSKPTFSYASAVVLCLTPVLGFVVVRTARKRRRKAAVAKA